VTALGDEKLVKAVLADFRAAPISDTLRAMLAFLEKQTLRPDEVGRADVASLRAAGLDDAAIESAMYVAFCFNVMDRLADAFDFELTSERGLVWVARILLKVGYGAGVVPG